MSAARGTAARPRPAAEEIGEDVAEILLGDATLLVVFRALRALGVAPVGGMLRPLGAARVDLAAIVARPLLGIG